MTANNEQQKSNIDYEASTDLKDYFCPFCNHKLFRGKVAEFNMVCSHCNKLVRSSNIPSFEEEENKEEDTIHQ